MHLNVHGRETTPLSGTWQAIPDPYDVFGVDGPFGGRQIYDPDPDGGRGDADIDDGYEIAVPGCWNEELDGFERYEDAMWYGRRFDWDGDESERAFVHVGAANYRSDVWLNGTKIGSHEGGFTPFAFEVTEEIEPREDNLLVVRVDASREDRKLPTPVTDWFNFGGITREVELATVPERFLRNVKVETDIDGDEVQVSVRAWVDDAGTADESAPRVELPALDRAWTLESAERFETSPHVGSEEVASGTVYRGTATVPRESVEFWHPEHPTLYDVEVSIDGEGDGDGDRLTEQVGLRTLAVDGSDVLLNGEPVEFRGVSLHEEAEGRGRSLTPADRAERFEWLADLDCNFARLAHYPHHPAMARRADEEGVLLWEEAPAYWFVDFGEESVQENYRQQLRGLIQRDWNRASVALWSIANETDRKDEDRNEVLPEMADYVRELDPTRLVTAACFMDRSGEKYRMADPLSEHLDVFGLNQYLGWYYGDAGDMEKFDDDPSGPPIVVSEVGASAKRGHHGPSDEKWTEEYQARVVREQTRAIDDLEQVCGLAVWLLFDMKTPRRQNPLQRGYNIKGLIDKDGHKKAAFDVLAEYYSTGE